MQQAQMEGWHGPQAAWATAPRGVLAVSQQRPQLSVIVNSLAELLANRTFPPESVFGNCPCLGVAMG